MNIHEALKKGGRIWRKGGNWLCVRVDNLVVEHGGPGWEPVFYPRLSDFQADDWEAEELYYPVTEDEIKRIFATSAEWREIIGRDKRKQFLDDLLTEFTSRKPVGKE